MAKEILKSNVVDALTLFVGVGGTGCDIVKRVAAMCREGETDNVNFACLDTNVNDLKEMSNSKINLNPIQTSNTQTVGNYLNYDDDALNNWFPKNAVMYGKTVSEGAGQVRAISRLALNATIKVGNLEPIYRAIDDLYRKTGKAMKQAMRCVIVTTASGGTGSGMLLPLSMLLRNYVHDKYPNSSIFTRVLVLLPETLDSVILSNVEKESQRRNAYATIKEINAFMMKGSGFFEIIDELKRFRDLHIDVDMPGTGGKQSLASLPCDFCFLLDGQNSEDSTLVSLEQYKVQAAQALYEQNIGPMQKKAFSMEDNIIKELSNPGNYGRNRFGGIGASIIRYPYNDVADYIAYDWANDSIGGEKEASKWRKYDDKYQSNYNEAKKNGIPESERPKIEAEYVLALDNESDSFSIDLRNRYLSEAEEKVADYFMKLSEQMQTVLTTTPRLSQLGGQVSHLSKELDYNDDKHKYKAPVYLSRIRSYESAVKMNAKKYAEALAEGIFNNENRTFDEKREYTIEKLLKNSDGPIHPNAMRYLLYKVKTKFDSEIEVVEGRIRDTEKSLLKYSRNAHLPDVFDVDFTKKGVEVNVDQLCDLEAKRENEGFLDKLKEKIANFNDVIDAINRHLKNYYNGVNGLARDIVDLESYRAGKKYVDEYCKAFELFYKTFPDKVSWVKREQEDLVDKLAFRKGDSVRNVCATKSILDELSKRTQSKRAEGTMLDPELNGELFDAIKTNVRYERDMQTLDVAQEDKRVDVFDKILMEYFKQKVRKDCDEIDMNIIKALETELILQTNIDLEKERQELGETEDTSQASVPVEERERYIRNAIAMGERLAAPGIQMMPFEEPRVINVCSYNKSLDAIRNYRIADLITNGEGVDTVSKYELRFFNALYNLTPDKLKKFAAPVLTETGYRVAGLYQRAYTNYSKYIGPDSTKNMMISTHIDKRWDSISVMPELDLNYQRERVIKIHKAMLYALIYNAIVYKTISKMTDNQKKVYVYHDSDDEETEMIVSNGTLCDEFYEILDSLYISSAMVEDIEELKAKKRKKDLVKNSDYNQTDFKKNLDKLKLRGKNIDSHEKTSLFEVPLVYYNSLPNSQRFDAELSALIDAVIDVFREELSIWEKSDDAKFILCDILKNQYDLLIENYVKYPSLHMDIDVKESNVIALIFGKIREVMSGTPEPDDFENIVTQMKAKMRMPLQHAVNEGEIDQ